MNIIKLKCWRFFSIFSIFLILVLFQSSAKAYTNWRDQQRESDDLYYQQLDDQREFNRQRDYQELRQTQFEQEQKYQEEMRKMRALKKESLHHIQQPRNLK